MERKEEEEGGGRRLGLRGGASSPSSKGASSAIETRKVSSERSGGNENFVSRKAEGGEDYL